MRIIAAFGVILALAAAPAVAGIVYEIEVKDHGQSEPKSETTEMAVEGKNIKMEVASGSGSGKGDVIFNGDRRQMVVVDHEDKSYTVIDEGTMKEIAGMLSGLSEQMAKALESVPADQRAAVEKMMKERMPQAQQAPARLRVDVRRTGETDTRAGYPCVRYDAFRGGAKTRELWVTDWDNVEGSEEVVGAFQEMAGFIEELVSALPIDQAPGGLADSIALQLQELDGFPVVTREYESDGSLESESTLRSARRRTLDPADFEPPAGYKRRSMLGGS